MSQVFISYAHKDEKFVTVLKRKLIDAGFEPLIDSDFLRPGEDWRQEIDGSIRNSFALIAVMSPAAFESKYVTYEWAFALGLGIKVIPLMLEKTQLHPRLDTLQYIPFDDHFSLDNAWEKLLARLKQIETEYKSTPKTILPDTVPASVQGAIDLLNHPQYAYTDDKALLGNIRNNINTLASSKHPAAKDAFLRGLEHSNPFVRKTVIEILGNIRDKTAISSLNAAIRDTDLSVRTAAIKALALIGDQKCITGLVDALGDHDYRVRLTAADGLSNFKTNKALYALIDALDDKVGYVRAHAAKSLGIIEDARAVTPLSRLLSDDAETVSRFTYEALQNIGTAEAIAVIDAWKDFNHPSN